MTDRMPELPRHQIDGSVVVTGGGRGIGRAIVERLAESATHVVVLERDADALSWLAEHRRTAVLSAVVGSATDPDALAAAVATATRHAPLVGWVNNAAVFRDVDIVDDGPTAFLAAVRLNLEPVVAGAAVAVRAFRSTGIPGSIVSLSSHQATRAVPGAAAYATAKAAVEGLTRALAVDHGRHGIRVNAVAPGSIRTERWDEHLAGLGADAAAGAESLVAAVHPLGRIGAAEEVAGAVEFLLSPAAGFVSGVTLPVDGGRSAFGPDPEAR